MKRILILMLAAVALLIGCAKGEDGKDGDAYGYLLGTSGVTAVDFSEIGITADPIYYNTRYQLSSGAATIYWLVSSTWYYSNVEIEIEEGDKGKAASMPLFGKAEKGDDGRDHLYYSEIITSTVYWDDEWVDHGDAPATLSTLEAGGVVDGAELAIPNMVAPR